jgi:hypothetical protein
MTVKELQDEFENEFATHIQKGLGTISVFSKVAKGMMTNEKADTIIHPSTHKLYSFRPFIFDTRQLPETFREFELEITTNYETIPDELRLDEEGMVHFHVCRSPEKLKAWAEEHALEICEQLNDYTFTLQDLCNMLADGDFERYKRICKEAELRDFEEEEEE